MLGLKWEDVNLEEGTLQVRRTLTTAKGGPVFSTAKTKGSRRSVRLTQSAVEALRRHVQQQLGEIDRAGSLWEENGLIFASETGTLLDRRHVTTRHFKPLLKHAKLPQIRFHDLRHTCATLLLTKNVNPKNRLRDVGACHCSDNARHLFTRNAQHIERGCQSYGGCP